MKVDPLYRYFADRIHWMDTLTDYSMKVIRDIKYMPFKFNKN